MLVLGLNINELIFVGKCEMVVALMSPNSEVTGFLV